MTAISALVAGLAGCGSEPATPAAPPTCQSLDEGLTIQLLPAPPGHYDAVVRADGAAIEVSTDDAWKKHTLADGRILWAKLEPAALRVWYDHGGGPAALQVTVARDGVMLASEALAPTYRTRCDEGLAASTALPLSRLAIRR